mmetsp:Transcript_41366/g.98080  ORF Transcript_41366/g.98080 Transcript_41366/m.98080 type:complete len:210 (+) Transcript_41366:134-763(+)
MPVRGEGRRGGGPPLRAKQSGSASRVSTARRSPLPPTGRLLLLLAFRRLLLGSLHLRLVGSEALLHSPHLGCLCLHSRRVFLLPLLSALVAPLVGSAVLPGEVPGGKLAGEEGERDDRRRGARDRDARPLEVDELPFALAPEVSHREDPPVPRLGDARDGPELLLVSPEDLHAGLGPRGELDAPQLLLHGAEVVHLGNRLLPDVAALCQ